MNQLDSLDALSLQFWLPVGVSIVCGAIVGFERQLRGKPLDVRTAVLVCLGTNVYIRLGVVISGEHTDTMRILGQVVTGIGFLGAGVIFNRGAHVQGLTTAAVVDPRRHRSRHRLRTLLRRHRVLGRSLYRVERIGMD